jgi:hypothetical protein
MEVIKDLAEHPEAEFLNSSFDRVRKHASKLLSESREKTRLQNQLQRLQENIFDERAPLENKILRITTRLSAQLSRIGSHSDRQAAAVRFVTEYSDHISMIVKDCEESAEAAPTLVEKTLHRTRIRECRLIQDAVSHLRDKEIRKAQNSANRIRTLEEKKAKFAQRDKDRRDKMEAKMREEHKRKVEEHRFSRLPKIEI